MKRAVIIHQDTKYKEALGAALARQTGINTAFEPTGEEGEVILDLKNDYLPVSLVKKMIYGGNSHKPVSNTVWAVCGLSGGAGTSTAARLLKDILEKTYEKKVFLLNMDPFEIEDEVFLIKLCAGVNINYENICSRLSDSYDCIVIDIKASDPSFVKVLTLSEVSFAVMGYSEPVRIKSEKRLKILSEKGIDISPFYNSFDPEAEKACPDIHGRLAMEVDLLAENSGYLS